jgi:hypothetical protein
VHCPRNAGKLSLMNYAQFKNYRWIIIADDFFVSVECSCQNITAGELTCLFSMEEIVL